MMFANNGEELVTAAIVLRCFILGACVWVKHKELKREGIKIEI